MNWPAIDSGYALAGVSLVALAYVIISVTRFMGMQLSAIERITTTLDNHLHEVAERLAEVASVLRVVDDSLRRITDDVDDIKENLAKYGRNSG